MHIKLPCHWVLIRWLGFHGSAFDLEREREWKQKENALKVQVAQLEATLRADVGEKGSILDRLNDERDEHEKMEAELREMRVKFYQTKQENDELKDKMKFFTKESAVDFRVHARHPRPLLLKLTHLT